MCTTLFAPTNVVVVVAEYLSGAPMSTDRCAAGPQVMRVSTRTFESCLPGSEFGVSKMQLDREPNTTGYSLGHIKNNHYRSDS